MRRASAITADDLAGPRFNIALRVPGFVTRHPRDTVAAVVAGIACIAIAVNVLAMQSGAHPAPLFAAKPKPMQVARTAETLPAVKPTKSVPLPVPRKEQRAETVASITPPVTPVSAPAAPMAAKPAVAAQHAAAPVPPAAIPAATPAKPSRRVLAVQRALSEYGYGTIKPTGVMGPETQSAVEKFERDRKLPVTGQVSERVVKELASITGRSFD